ncbi:hypothetical protein MUG84_26895 [Paenibacillus sp. KQZ6P-2]|uniref:Uncharacterized protein n=1 Tax=Paenibacillus mangrovi TaxID=2931978 RepID=A0A9X1WXE4_9BACL|nr:hypothetical protein [Paenibacillus mangrovi]MCJ8015298.1 hypothetical protein [Paenibacillus mangrovi]
MGEITDHLHYDDDIGCLTGDGFVQAPDGSRAGVIWQVEGFTRFKVERNLQNLYNFTPEDMVLIYLYCLSIGDPDLIYAITFNGGQLPEQDKFRKNYFEYVMNYDSETAVHYRYFDSIKVDESTAEENRVTVLITVSIETTTHSMALGLQKEDQVWKLDIYPMIKEYINKASKNKTK